MTTLRRNRVDLHTHTRRSDGVLEPAELHAQMRAYGMAVVAITDHDTLAGAEALVEGGLGGSGAAGATGVPRVITGVEINTVGDDVLGRFGLGRDGEELHILGYGLDPADATLGIALARQRAGRWDRIALTLERIRGLGMHVDLDLDAAAAGGDPDAAIGRPHVARALVAAGYATSVNDAFDRYLDHAGPCYVPRQGLGPRDAIEAIAAAGGIPVLAHSPDAADRRSVMRELMDWGLRGLEVYYGTWEVPLVARMAAFADGLGLLATGGSDYHGDEMDYATAQGRIHVPDAVGVRLLDVLGA